MRERVLCAMRCPVRQTSGMSRPRSRASARGFPPQASALGAAGRRRGRLARDPEGAAVKRRDFLAGAAGALALPGAALAQVDPLDPLVRALANGAPVRKGKVTLVLPQLADNGNSVPIRITVDSPMTAADHVKSIHLYS